MMTPILSAMCYGGFRITQPHIQAQPELKAGDSVLLVRLRAARLSMNIQIHVTAILTRWQCIMTETKSLHRSGVTPNFLRVLMTELLIIITGKALLKDHTPRRR